MLAVGSLDVVFSLPLGVTNLAFTIVACPKPLQFYGNWTNIHSGWAPASNRLVDMELSASFTVAWMYVRTCSSCAISFAIFFLFGFTPKARDTYRMVFSFIFKLHGSREYTRPKASPEKPISVLHFNSATTTVASDSKYRHYLIYMILTF